MSEPIVLVSDLHGNYPVLQAVIDAEGKNSEYIILGDIMGLNAYPEQTLELVQEIGNFVLAGNHDRAIFEYGEGHVVSDELSEFELQHTLSSLSAEQVEWMLELPYIEAIQHGNARICLTHAYPWTGQASGMEPGNAGVRKRDVVEVAGIVEDDYDYVFTGHTHEQYDLDCGEFGHDVHFVNPGSLGYDHTYSIVDTDSGEVEHKSVEVEEDVQAHVQKLLPDDAPHTEEWF